MQFIKIPMISDFRKNQCHGSNLENINKKMEQVQKINK